MRHWCKGRWSVLGGVLLVAGCASTSLIRPPDYRSVVGKQPSSVALADIQDQVECDDEAYYLQEYLEGKRIFYTCTLADREDPMAYHGADVVIAGKIVPTIRTKVLGWGKFASIITLGGYYLLGGPTRERETQLDYHFNVTYTERGQTKAYRFTDVRKGKYGLYAPRINLDKKPGLYESGWDQLLYQICRELRGQRAGKGL